MQPAYSAYREDRLWLNGLYLYDFLTFTDEEYTCDMSVMH